MLADQMMHPMADWAYRNVKGWVTYDQQQAHRLPDYVYAIPEAMARTRGMGPAWDGIPWVQPHFGLRCARKGPTMLALNGYLYGASGTQGAETFAQTADIGLCVSPTGYRFEDVWPLRPFVRRGLRGTWDQGMTAQTAMVDHGDQTCFYYIGNDVGNFSGRYQSGMAYIPRDRYGYRCISGYRQAIRARKTATFTCKPMVMPQAAALGVNCSHVSRDKRIRIQLQDEQGKAIAGFSFRSCKPITRQGLCTSVQWTSGKNAASLAGKNVCVAVELSSDACGVVETDSPRIYALYLRGDATS